jgi:hypothetical protein
LAFASEVGDPDALTSLEEHVEEQAGLSPLAKSLPDRSISQTMASELTVAAGA